MDLQSKVAVITGGAVRVGKAITLALAEAGCHVFIVYGQSAGAAEQTGATAELMGVKTTTFSANLADPMATQRIIPAAVDWMGKVDVLVNSAAVFRAGELVTTTLESWDNQFAINLRAPFLLSQAFAQQIPEDGQGAIINIADARVFRPGPDHFAYRLTKAALISMTEALACDLAPRIRVNALALGAILPPSQEDLGYLEEVARTEIPLRRHGNANMVAQNVLHLLEQEFLTGVVIPIDGGQFL